MNPARMMTFMCLIRISAAVLLVLQVNTTAAADALGLLFAGLDGAKPDRAQSLATDRSDWHRDAIVYHLWVAAFRDSDGDGVGDLRGIVQTLDTLRELGVNTLWLSPFFRSASTMRNLHGYDVIDHREVDPRLGKNEDADELIREAHARGLRLIFDFVPNHVSTQHPWFIESRDPQSPKRDWFVWRDNQPTNGWTGFDQRSDWHALNGAYYYGIFWSGMPDVNHRNAAARLELARAARHWLDRGFDGIRMDAVRYLYENLKGDGAKADQEDQRESAAWFEAWRREVMDPYTAQGYAKFMVAENWTNERDGLLTYLSYEGRPGVHMTLNFPMLRAFTRLDAAAARELWEWGADLPSHACLGNFVSNHDMAADRPGTLFAGNTEKLRAQTAWLLLGPGVPFIYYGNEIGQPQGQQRGDTRHRQPLDHKELAKQRDDQGSMWHWHRRLNEVRREHSSVRRGKVRFLETNASNKLLALWREADRERTLTIFSGSADPLPALTVTLPADLQGTPAKWVLGSGPMMVDDAGLLNLGSCAPFESKVLLWGK